MAPQCSSGGAAGGFALCNSLRAAAAAASAGVGCVRRTEGPPYRPEFLNAALVTSDCRRNGADWNERREIHPLVCSDGQQQASGGPFRKP